MPVFNGWIIRALILRLRQPDMKPQRLFMLITATVLSIFVGGASVYLFRQPTEDALESAALKVFAAMGVLCAILISVAVVIRRRTEARWTTEEAMKLTSREIEVKELEKP